MITTKFLFDSTEYSVDDLAEVVAEQLAQSSYSFADNLRTAVIYCPKTMTADEFAEAAARCGVHPGTARNFYSEVRRWQRELGEGA